MSPHVAVPASPFPPMATAGSTRPRNLRARWPRLAFSRPLPGCASLACLGLLPESPKYTREYDGMIDAFDLFAFVVFAVLGLGSLPADREKLRKAKSEQRGK